MSIDPKVLEKIGKLLKVANDTASGGEHERDTAMRMALKMLARHNLSMDDISVSKKEEDRVKEVEDIRDDGWAGVLTKAVAELYFCTVFRTAGQNNKMRIVFIGLESNVATAREMVKYLINSVAKESRKHSSKNSFRNGAVSAIAARCNKLRAEAEKDDNFLNDDQAKLENQPTASTGTALVVAGLYQREGEANALMLKNMGITLKDARRTSTRNSDADSYHAGRSYGNTVSLNKQIK